MIGLEELSAEMLRVYFRPADIGPDGYPCRWHKTAERYTDDGMMVILPSIKTFVRECAGNRCERCGHPYNGGGEWSPCDEKCEHGDGPVRVNLERGDARTVCVDAQWRILTVHHLNGVKHDCRWWNLVALCQRCHLSVQSRVVMERPFYGEHSQWFREYVAGFYAWRYLGIELTRAETIARLDELLELEHRQLTIGGE